MFSPLTLIIVVCVYILLLLSIASWIERRALSGGRPAANPIIYSLSLAVYCTSWTFYGSVGKAASTQMLFLAFYIGTTLSMILGWLVLRKLVRIKTAHRITSIADFISTRYNRSQGLAAIATLIAIIGIAPYIALQLKAVTSTFDIITKNPESSWIGTHVGPIVAVLMIIFTNAFGVRRLDPTERHPGMMVAIAVESVIKLVAFLTAGIFITYFIYDGFSDIFERISEPGFIEMYAMQWNHSSYMTWATYIILAMSATLFLPRQFHVAVIENYDEKHIKTAMWLFPLYMLLINLFVLPVAMSGLFMGFPQSVADTFLLSIPFHYNIEWLSVLIFIGGFSAATSMIMISSMAMSTMVTNHLLLPCVEWFPALGFLRRHILRCRWVAVAGIITLGYYFKKTMGDSYMLVNMGVISFAAVLQFAPAMLGGIFWRRGNKIGALSGLSAGFITWFYTLILPAFVKSGWVSPAILENGPLNLAWLRPEQLLGLAHLNPVSHGVFWSLVINAGLYFLGSLLFHQHAEERQVAESFVNILAPARLPAHLPKKQAGIELTAKIGILEGMLIRYFPLAEAKTLMRNSLCRVDLQNGQKVSITQLSRFYADIEKTLSGIIGSAAAHMAMRREKLLSTKESEELSAVYAEILADLNVTPEELKEKIDYYQERENILEQHARVLETTVAEKEREINQRRRTETALKKSESRYRSLLEAAPDPIVVYDVDGRVTYINPAFTRVFGWTLKEWIGKDLFAYIPEEIQEETRLSLEKIRREGSIVGLETRRLDKNGRELDVSISAALYQDDQGRAIGMVVILSDISTRVQAEAERKRLEGLLRQAQKMEAIGTLAGGIAHDFNNILSAIIGFTELIQIKNQGNWQDHGYLEKILKASNRAKDLVQQILTFSRRTDQELKPVQAGVIAKEVLKLLRASLPTSIEIDQDIQSRSTILGNPTQIHQILMNLGTNAGHAMRESGGTLAVALVDQEIKPGQATFPELDPGHYLKITVTDTGQGISPEIIDRIFDPFFTTKSMEEGTGMGLAVVHGIVRSHGGTIQARSEPGLGAEFTILLPALEKKAESDLAPVKNLPTGSEQILLVDDEAILVDIGKSLLESLGYSVTTKTNGIDALELFEKEPDRFDLVITDMTMPKMAGDELARNIMALKPDMPVIICTGYSTRITEQKALEMGIRALIMKPFVVTDFAEKVRRILDARN